MNNDNLIWLLKWYHSQCEGDWEHGNGVLMGTIDNPGWYLRVNLEETELQNKQFQKIKIDRSEHDWIRCFIENNMFEGVGGPLICQKYSESFAIGLNSQIKRSRG